MANLNRIVREWIATDEMSGRFKAVALVIAAALVYLIFLTILPEPEAKVQEVTNKITVEETVETTVEKTVEVDYARMKELAEQRLAERDANQSVGVEGDDQESATDREAREFLEEDANESNLQDIAETREDMKRYGTDVNGDGR